MQRESVLPKMKRCLVNYFPTLVFTDAQSILRIASNVG